MREQTYPVEFTINLDPKSPVRYYGIDRNLSDQLSAIAKHRGISAEKLLHLWVEEKLKGEQIYG